MDLRLRIARAEVYPGIYPVDVDNELFELERKIYTEVCEALGIDRNG